VIDSARRALDFRHPGIVQRGRDRVTERLEHGGSVEASLSRAAQPRERRFHFLVVAVTSIGACYPTERMAEA
jgi:hypothetical protein